MADFVLREKQRTTYPGACSLEYQDLMRILIEDLLQWDPDKQEAKGKGVLGTVLAFAPANEEQGRNTLHSHWQIWTKELNSDIRHNIFHTNPEVKRKSREKFFRLLDQVMSTSFSDDFEIRHDCDAATVAAINTPNSISSTSDAHFSDRSEQCFRDARNKTLSKVLRGRVSTCNYCDSPISSSDIVNLALDSWKQVAVKNGSNIVAAIPFGAERMDIAAYTYSYHMDETCPDNSDPFWGNKKVRDTILHHVFDQHDWNHRGSCFKKGVDCRFFLPDLTHLSTEIYEDVDPKKTIVSHRLVAGDTTVIPSWVLEQKRPMGCQYMNTHCKSIAEVFNCNTNIRIGDRSQVFYSTLYCGKSTQKEDSERVQRINTAINKRLLRIQEQVLSGERKEDEIQDGFVEGLCRMLSAMNAATTRHVVSATMAHLLVCSGGDRFMFSHGFGNLLVGQLEATLQKQPVDVRIRVNNFGGETIFWPDSSSDDYIHRPQDPRFSQLCAYEMTMNYKKTYMTKRQIAASAVNHSHERNSSTSLESDTSDDDHDAEDSDCSTGQGYHKRKYHFNESHPGKRFSHLAQLKKTIVPKVYFPGNGLCRIEDLKLDDHVVDGDTSKLREQYAKYALLMFQPFRTLADLKLYGTYWNLFYQQLTLHRGRQPSLFFAYGFQILQNIEDRQSMDANSQRASDRVTTNTECLAPGADTKSVPCCPDNIDNSDDILQYCGEDG